MNNVRGLWAALVLAPSVLLAERSARADVILPAVDVPWVLDANCHTEGLLHGARRCFSKRWVPESVAAARHAKAMARPLAGGGAPACDGNPITAYSLSNTPGSMGAPDLVAAYGLAATGLPSGAGKIVAVIDACGYGTLLADLAAYRAAYGLPAITQCGGKNGVAPTPGGAQCIGIVSQTGTATLPTQDSGWSGESALDVQMVSAACPACSILVVQANDATTLDTALAEAVTLKADAVSNSWGGNEDGETLTVKPGTLITAASGDADYMNQIQETDFPDGGVSFAYTPTSPNWPASSPDVVAIGGTTLTKDSSSSRCYTDTAWSVTVPATAASPYAGDTVYGGGSGCSSQYDTPAYQTGLAMGSCAKRGSVDLAAAADFSPGAFAATECTAGQVCGGIAVYGGGGWNPSVGTSALTPFITAVLVRTGLAAQASTFTNTAAAPGPAYFYSHGSTFTDVTAGNNDPSKTCTDVMCNAGVGWDGPTGWGAPDAYGLALLGGATGVVRGASECAVAPSLDAGLSDAATTSDASTPTTDGGPGRVVEPGDAATGATSDAAVPIAVGDDSGTTPSAGDDAGPGGNGLNGSGSSGGCSCTAGPAQTLPFASLLAFGSLLLLGARRRRT